MLETAHIRTPHDVAVLVRRLCCDGDGRVARARLSFLVGAGFSASAGIPTAPGMVAQYLRPRLPKTDTGNHRESEYAALMRQLVPSERTDVVRNAIVSGTSGADPATKRSKINWAHLWLANLIEAGYVRRVLTTNFDPLIVDALALMGLPVRTFDLASSQHFIPGALEDGAVVYLHGQAHSLLLSNTIEEFDAQRLSVRAVLQEAVGNSTLVVVGYSGDADFVLDELDRAFPHQFPHAMFWVHFSPSDAEPVDQVKRIIGARGREAYLVVGHDADAFMHAFVNEGLGLAVPRLVEGPLEHVLAGLQRVLPYPQPRVVPSSQLARTANARPPALDPVQMARERLRAIIDAGSMRLTAGTAGGDVATSIAIAATKGDLSALKDLSATVQHHGSDMERNVLADAFIEAANDALLEGRLADAESAIGQAEALGTSAAWLPTLQGELAVAQALSASDSARDALFEKAEAYYARAIDLQAEFHPALNNWGAALATLAKFKCGAEASALRQRAAEKYEAALRLDPSLDGVLYNWANVLADEAREQSGVTAARLFDEAGQRYAKAVRLRPSFPEALDSWGATLAEQARIHTGDVAQRLRDEAVKKFAAALRVNPTKHEALYNWGTVLLEQARAERGPRSQSLFQEAAEKFAAAVQIKPDKHEALNNWGSALAGIAATASGAERTAYLEQASAKFAASVQVKPDKHEAFYNWADTLVTQAKMMRGERADRAFQEAYQKYAAALTIRSDFGEALNGWATALTEQACQKEGAEADRIFERGIEKYSEALRLRESHEVLTNWARLLVEQARRKGGAEAVQLLEEAIARCEAALRLRPNSSEALNNLGTALVEQAKAAGGSQARALYAKAADTYSEVMRLEPRDLVALVNWGNVLVMWANSLQGLQADTLYAQAYEKYFHAVEAEPPYEQALLNWALALAQQASSKRGDEAEVLLHSATTHLNRLLKIRPESEEALNNLGTILLRRASSKEGPDATTLWEEATRVHETALRINPDSWRALYNLACAAARRGQVLDVIAYLERWRGVSPAPARATILNDRDFATVLNDPAFTQFVSTLPE